MSPKVSNHKSIPFRFFVITFLWSWLLWLPFVLGGLGIWEWDESLRSNLSMPAIILGAFGPGIATVYSLKKSLWKKGFSGLSSSKLFCIAYFLVFWLLYFCSETWQSMSF